MTVHIAGFALRIGNLLRQRCAWCGVVIIDDNLELMASPGGPEEPLIFELNALVDMQVSGPVRSQSVVVPVDGELPPDCCTKPRAPLRLVASSARFEEEKPPTPAESRYEREPE